MFSESMLTRPIVESLVGRVSRLKQTIASAGERLRERIASAVGREVARAVRDAVRRLLDLPDLPTEVVPVERPDPRMTEDEDEHWSMPEPIQRPRWRRAVSVLGRMAAVWLGSSVGSWPVLAALTTGVAVSLGETLN